MSDKIQWDHSLFFFIWCNKCWFTWRMYLDSLSSLKTHSWWRGDPLLLDVCEHSGHITFSFCCLAEPLGGTCTCWSQPSVFLLQQRKHYKCQKSWQNWGQHCREQGETLYFGLDLLVLSCLCVPVLSLIWFLHIIVTMFNFVFPPSCPSSFFCYLGAHLLWLHVFCIFHLCISACGFAAVWILFKGHCYLLCFPGCSIWVL